jgi:endonuclease/exonuclease/phosphatase family metal-dependent hydrolase
MKKIILCSLVILIVVYSGCSRRKSEDEIKVMTLNIRYDNPGDSANAWPARAAIVNNFIKSQQPDLFGLQEVLLHQYEYLDSVLADYGSVGVGRDDGIKEGEMTPVFYKKDRFDIVRTLSFWLSETPEIPGSKDWGSSLPRIVTWMELVDKITHEHLFFFNTHFAHDSDSARIMSSKLLLSRVDSLAAKFPFIITGDFNMIPGSEGYEIFTGPAESVPLIRDSYAVSEKNPEGPAFTYNGFSEDPGSGRIDYIFVKDGLKVLYHKTSIRKEQGIYISDHWPVIALISLRD